jgi:hypothetical protein
MDILLDRKRVFELFNSGCERGNIIHVEVSEFQRHVLKPVHGCGRPASGRNAGPQ